MTNKLLREVENDEFGDISEFEEPSQMRTARSIKDQPTYADAWKLFVKLDRDPSIEGYIRQIVPAGSGSFEAWWLGKSSDNPLFSSYSSGITKKITKEDIDEIAKIDKDEVYSLFNNCYYNNDLGKYLDRDVLLYLIQRLIYLAADETYIQKCLESDFFDILDNLGMLLTKVYASSSVLQHVHLSSGSTRI